MYHRCRQGQAQGATLLPQFEPLLLLRTAVSALKGNRPDPGPAPWVAGGSSAATKVFRTATSLPEGSWTRWEEGTSKHSGSQAHVGWWGCHHRAGWREPRGLRGRKGSIQHIQICPRHRWEGWARQKSSSSSCPAGRWRESSLSFQRGGPAGPRRYGDTQIHRWQPRCPGRAAGGHGAQIHREREEGQRGEKPVAALTLLSAVGYHPCSPPM